MRRGIGGRKRIWSDESALEALRLEAARLGRAPTALEMGGGESPCPTVTLYRQRFGTWNEALKRAGLPPRMRGQPLHRPTRSQVVLALRRAQEITAEKRRYWLGGAA